MFIERIDSAKRGSSPTVREGVPEPGAVATGSETQLDRSIRLATARGSDPNERPPLRSGYCLVFALRLISGRLRRTWHDKPRIIQGDIRFDLVVHVF